MTDEELKLYRVCQPRFEELMGPMIHGDKVLLKGGYEDIYCEDCVQYKIFSPHIFDESLRLPLPIDSVHPERGLWGMVDWGNAQILAIHSDGDITIARKGNFIGRFPPAIALLRALVTQWGLEVSND
jgi:hypothetical protein